MTADDKIAALLEFEEWRQERDPSMSIGDAIDTYVQELRESDRASALTELRTIAANLSYPSERVKGAVFDALERLE